jgi:hypothetical protein
MRETMMLYKEIKQSGGVFAKVFAQRGVRLNFVQFRRRCYHQDGTFLLTASHEYFVDSPTQDL